MNVPWGLLGLLGLAGVLAIAAVLLLSVRRLRHPPRRTAGWALARGRPVDPGDLDLSFREDEIAGMPIWIAARDESTLASEQAPTVVLLHGWGRSRRDTLGRLEPWRRRGFRMVLPDLRGHGDAAGPSTLGTAEVDDLVSLLGSLPPGRIHLCGHSMGGVVAIHAAARLAEAEDSAVAGPADLAGVVAIAPYERVEIPAIAQLEAGGVGARRLAAPLRGLLRLGGMTDRSTCEAAARLAVPLLVVHGSEDRLCPPPDARRIAEAAGVRGRFVEIAGAGHDDRSPAVLEAIESAIDSAIETAIDSAIESSPDGNEGQGSSEGSESSKTSQLAERPDTAER